jgi:hypothetical protein
MVEGFQFSDHNHDGVRTGDDCKYWSCNRALNHYAVAAREDKARLVSFELNL